MVVWETTSCNRHKHEYGEEKSRQGEGEVGFGALSVTASSEGSVFYHNEVGGKLWGLDPWVGLGAQVVGVQLI